MISISFLIRQITFKGYALIRHCNLFMKQGCLIRIRYSGCAPIRKMDTQISSYDVIAWHGGSRKINFSNLVSFLEIKSYKDLCGWARNLKNPVSWVENFELWKIYFFPKSWNKSILEKVSNLSYNSGSQRRLYINLMCIWYFYK